MYRRPLAGVFEFGSFWGWQERKQGQVRRPEASGTKGKGEKNDVVRAPGMCDRAALLRWDWLEPASCVHGCDVALKPRSEGLRRNESAQAGVPVPLRGVL